MGYQEKGSVPSSTTASSKSLHDAGMSSQTCLSGDKAGEDTGKHASPTSKVIRVLKSIWFTRTMEDTTQNSTLHVKTTLRELIIYVIFLAILCILSFGMANPINYYYTNIMSNLLTTSASTPEEGEGVAFADIASMDDFWAVMEQPMLDSIYWETWYNGDNVSSDQLGAIYFENKVLGLPRLRQVRVKKNSCKVHPKFVGAIAHCYDSYASSSEEKEPFGIYETDRTNMNDTAFVYNEKAGSSYSGTMASYNGGGYVKDLASTKDESKAIIDSLKQNLWLDRGTRAVFLDFTVYNANINLFCQVRLLVEFPATGGAMASSVFRTVKLIRYVTALDYFVLACEVMFIFFILYYTVEEALEIKIHKLKYFTDNIWNILDVVVIIISYICVLFNIYRMIKVDAVLETLLQNMDQHIDFEFLCFWQTQFNNAIALTVFISWIKIFKYISFNKTMTQLSSTLAGCAKDIAGFAVMFYVVFFAYAQLGYLLFGAQLQDYSTFPTAMFTLFRIILGDFDFTSLESASKILGPIYFMSYVFFVFFVLLNMFLAIINDTYSEVKADIANQKSDVELGDFFKKGYDKIMNKLNIKRDKIVDIQSAMFSGDKNNDKKLDFDEWRTELRSRGYSDVEIEAFFAKYDTDGDRVLNENEQELFKDELKKEADELDQQFENLKKAKDADEAYEEERLKANIVSNEEFNILTKRVDTMESSIGNIVSRIDSVLSKLETIEKAKLKRREAMAKILDAINDPSNVNDIEKKRQLEKMIRDELEKWDDPMLMNSATNSRGNSATASAARKSPF